MAAFNGDLHLMKLLEDNGADIEVKTHSGINALHMASQGNQPASLNHLTTNFNSFDLNCRDNSGATPLIWAAFCGCEVALTFLLA